MYVTVAGIVIVSTELSEKAFASIVVTPFGSDTDEIPVQFCNAPAPIVVVPAAIAREVLPSGTSKSLVLEALYKHPSDEAYAPLPDATEISERLPHPLKASVEILLTLAGMLTELRDAHP